MKRRELKKKGWEKTKHGSGKWYTTQSESRNAKDWRKCRKSVALDEHVDGREEARSAGGTG